MSSNMVYGFFEIDDDDSVICNECLEKLGIKRYKTIDSQKWFYGKRCYSNETLGYYIYHDRRNIVNEAFKIVSKIKKQVIKKDYSSVTYNAVESDNFTNLKYENEYHIWPHIYEKNTKNVAFAP